MQSNKFWNLHLFLYADNEEIVDLLIKHGANINLTSSINGQTPLHLAAASNFKQQNVEKNLSVCLECNSKLLIYYLENAILGTLLKAGADVNAVDQLSLTPLISAAKEGTLKIDKFKSFFGLKSNEKSSFSYV